VEATGAGGAREGDVLLLGQVWFRGSVAGVIPHTPHPGISPSPPSLSPLLVPLFLPPSLPSSVPRTHPGPAIPC